MNYRKLGRCFDAVSPIAFGAFKIGRNEKTKYDRPYPLPSEEAAAELLNGVLDAGVNLIDTAPAYGLSEERIGRHIGHRRAEFILSTKAGETFENGQSSYDFSEEAIRQSIDRSLRRLRTQAVDLLLIHSDGRDEEILAGDAVPALQEIKRLGKTRLIGFSGKTIQGAELALEWADVLMIEYHLQDRSHEDVIAQAAARGIGILVKKPLASGKIPPEIAIPVLLANPAISSLVIGGLSLNHIGQNLRISSLASK
jgi:aryl-alcohol dehydrogenase-like predicted oxidoreductase